MPAAALLAALLVAGLAGTFLTDVFFMVSSYLAYLPGSATAPHDKSAGVSLSHRISIVAAPAPAEKKARQARGALLTRPGDSPAYPIINYLMVENFCSSALVSTAPGIRLPSAKKMVGVPETRSCWPSARIFSCGLAQVVATVAGSLPFSIQSSQALLRSGEHQILRDLTIESGDRMLYMKV